MRTAFPFSDGGAAAGVSICQRTGQMQSFGDSINGLLQCQLRPDESLGASVRHLLMIGRVWWTKDYSYWHCTL